MKWAPDVVICRLLVVSVVWAVSLIASPVAAQANAAPEEHAITGSDSGGSATDDRAQSAPGTVAPEDLVLKKGSIFFPNLATSRTPLTADEKFVLSLKNSIAPASILGSAFGAGINQATNTPSGYGQGAEGYGKRFGASMATRATTNLFGGFMIASIAHQDPRYFVHGKGTFGQRLGHAISRVVVAPKDRGGYGFNWGGVFGPLGAEALANTYQPVAEQTGARTMTRYGIDLASTAGGNILREFWPDIFKRLGLKK
jgi:hypothetical protein